MVWVYLGMLWGFVSVFCSCLGVFWMYASCYMCVLDEFRMF